MPDPFTLKIVIARTRFSLAVRGSVDDVGALVPVLERKFAAFHNGTGEGPAAPVVADFALDVELVSGIAGPHEACVTRLAPGQTRIEGRGLSARLDDSGRVEARIAAPAVQPMENLMRLLLAGVLTARGGGLFHAASIAEGGAALLFPGKSEAGKSTLALKAKPGTVLSDEMSAIWLEGASYVAAPTPFWGDAGNVLSRNSDDRRDPMETPDSGLVPSWQGPARPLELQAICLLGEKGRKTCERATPARAVQGLMATTLCCSNDPADHRCIEDNSRAMAVAVPVLILSTGREEPWDRIRIRIRECLAMRVV